MERPMSVQVRKADIRSSPSFLGRIVQAVHYAERVMTFSSKESWVKVSYKGRNGWMHLSALTRKKIVLDPADYQDQMMVASSDELALAGKGFNKQVEGQFRKRHKNVSFSWVDKAERIKVSQQEIQEFVRDGKLVPREEQS